MKKKRRKNKLAIFVFLLCIGALFLRLLEEKERVQEKEVPMMIEEQQEQETIEIEGNTMEKLYDLSLKDERILTIIEEAEQYPEVLLDMLSRNIDLIDYVLEYPKKKGQVFSDTIGKVTKGEVPLLLQYDKHWGYGEYGDSVIAISGCGPTVVSMVVAGLTGREDITPYTVAKDAEAKGYYQNGTSWRLFTEGVEEYGIIGKELPLNKAMMIQALKANHPIICSMKKGDFTTTGHFIVLTGVKNNAFIVRDPNSEARSEKLWSYERLEPQIKNLWSFEKK